MAARKLQQEIDKTFKKVAEGIQTFEGIFEKIEQTSNASQKEKLEDALKREIKKLQRHREQIKAWASGNEIKDKEPLLEQRRAIENEMERFKTVEKRMKTKAFSKEGLSATAKLDPKEKEKLERAEFLSGMVEELERQIETLEAEEESLQATVKKGKKSSGKTDRLSEISRTTEKHKFHQGKLELLLRAMQNGHVEAEQVQELEDGIRYYVEENQSVDFMEDDAMYDDLNLEEDEGLFGLVGDAEKASSQDAQSTQEEFPEGDSRGSGSFGKPKSTSMSEPSTAAARRPSNNFKSTLPALGTLHTSPSISSSLVSKETAKPVSLPLRPPGETLKYASAAAAAASSEKGAVGLAPLPPPASTSGSSLNSAVSSTNAKSSNLAASNLPTSSVPAVKTTIPPVSVLSESSKDLETGSKTPPPPSSQINVSSAAPKKASVSATTSTHSNTVQRTSISTSSSPHQVASTAKPTDLSSKKTETGNSTATDGNNEPEAVYHLPPDLADLLQSLEVTKSRALSPEDPAVQASLEASANTRPHYLDAEKPRHYQPEAKYQTPEYYPQEPFTYADDPALYAKIDTDTLFYVFYYRQNTYQQYMAAKALKSQSWRFHKQYQTWFQRHEEPKTITEEYEQGTYRFFDYESTWMNRRKAEFRFAYKFLEDDL